MMVNLKTKVDKRVNDNEKRRRSIKEKEKAKWNQSQIIKQALSSTLSNNSSKKITFSDGEESGVEDSKSNGKNLNGEGKSVLFDDSGSEPDDFEIREKTQFRGKKGFELLNLQSTYGNDERFKIDERFLDDENQGSKEDSGKAPDDTDADAVGEKDKQLKILESVLGTPVVSSEKTKEKTKKRANEMVRYDASNKDHEIYEIHNQSNTAISTPSKKRKEGKRLSKTDRQDIPIPKVSKEKFYEVSNEIKSSFKDKAEECGQFSLLQTYGVDTDKNNEKKEEEEDVEGDLGSYMDEDDENYERDVKYRTEDKVVKEEPKVEEKSVLARGIWKEPFFFVKDDPRFKEGLEFINKKNSEEAQEASESYDKTRKKLKEILRLHLKKQMHKKDPFRNKVGGMNKKQLAGYKSKNPRMAFNKRKPPKKNPGGRT